MADRIGQGSATNGRLTRGARLVTRQVCIANNLSTYDSRCDRGVTQVLGCTRCDAHSCQFGALSVIHCWASASSAKSLICCSKPSDQVTRTKYPEPSFSCKA